MLGNEQQLKQLDRGIQQLDQAIASGQIQGQQLTTQQRQQLQEHYYHFISLGDHAISWSTIIYFKSNKPCSLSLGLKRISILRPRAFSC